MKNLFLLFALSFVFSAAFAQTRSETASATGVSWSELRCVRNGDGSVECSACTTPIVTSLGAEERPCSPLRVLRAMNAGRIDTVGAALVPSALRHARFPVDAGAP